MPGAHRPPTGPGPWRPRGFTLVELLVVIAIIATLIGLLLPAVQAVRESSRRSSCMNNIKQVALALQTFHDANRSLPPGYVSGFDSSGKDTGPGWGWAAHILPHVEQAAVFQRIDFKQPIEAPGSAGPRESGIATFLCPSDAPPSAPIPVGPRNSTGALTATTCSVSPANYIGSFGVGEPGIDGDGVFYRDSKVRFKDVTDGLSHTLMIGERSFRHSESTWVGAVTDAGQAPTPGCPMGLQVNNASNFVLGHSGESYDGPAGPTEINNFTSPHVGGCVFGFVDGHATFLGPSVDYATYKALSTRAKGDATTGVN